ncbi:MAG TPA: hypothetical protein EYQ24_05405 [Bacteroidetes bacterium]|nr:hypothetical protein [Bacteroidota bacterium]HIL57608.1 hypothetical protein [Rhodothermales bacterium]
MRRLLFLFALIFGLAFSATAQDAPIRLTDVTLAPNRGIPVRVPNVLHPVGSWDSTYGTLTMVQRADGRYIGNYSTYGKVNGRVEGQTLVGRFYHPENSGTCETTVQGSTNWGRFEFTFDRNGNFEGRWGWCGGEMTYSWDGTKL